MVYETAISKLVFTQLGKISALTFYDMGHEYEHHKT